MEKPLSLKTQMEQAAGRAEIEKAVKLEILVKGDRELARRFPSYLRNPHLEKDAASDEWTVQVCVQTATGTFMNFKYPLLGWPSDVLIAEIALVVP